MTEDLIRKNVADNLVRLRTRAGMTQAQLAEKLHYSDKSVSKWERGEGIPDVVVLAALAEEFGVTVGGLIGEEAPVPEEQKACFFPRRLLSLLIAVGLCFLAGFVLYGSQRLFLPRMPRRWVLFLYATFASSAVMTALFSAWRMLPARLLSVSLLIWSAGLSLHFTVSLFRGWAILCGILQVLCVLVFLRVEGLACLWPFTGKN